jgi:hypothetical protein
MAWIIATTLDKKHANLHTNLIAAILDRVPGSPEKGSEILFAAGAHLEVIESPAELLRSIESEEHPEDASPLPSEAW